MLALLDLKLPRALLAPEYSVSYSSGLQSDSWLMMNIKGGSSSAKSDLSLSTIDFPSSLSPRHLPQQQTSKHINQNTFFIMQLFHSLIALSYITLATATATIYSKSDNTTALSDELASLGSMSTAQLNT